MWETASAILNKPCRRARYIVKLTAERHLDSSAGGFTTFPCHGNTVNIPEKILIFIETTGSKVALVYSLDSPGQVRRRAFPQDALVWLPRRTNWICERSVMCLASNAFHPWVLFAPNHMQSVNCRVAGPAINPPSVAFRVKKPPANKTDAAAIDLSLCF